MMMNLLVAAVQLAMGRVYLRAR